MDDPNNPTSETPYGQPEGGAATAARRKLSETAAEVKDKVADFGRKTLDNIDESRKSTAGAGEDLKDIVKRYPGPALAAAALLGFIVARGFRRD
jgi:hypothetical protein